MVKFNTLNIILIVAIISLLYIVFFGEDEDYTQDYNVKIEALEQKVDSLHQTNISLKFEADSLGLRLESSDKKIKQLNTRIYVIKKELTKPVAKLIVKDLIQFDGLSQEMLTIKGILTETNSKLYTQGELVTNLKTQVLNYQSIIEKKSQQFTTQNELNKRLQVDLKKQKFKTKLIGGSTFLIAAGVIVLLK